MSGLTAKSTTGGVALDRVFWPERNEYGVRGFNVANWNKPGDVCVAADVTETTLYLPVQKNEKVKYGT